jgi:hypothetical protein
VQNTCLREIIVKEFQDTVKKKSNCWTFNCVKSIMLIKLTYSIQWSPAILWLQRGQELYQLKVRAVTNVFGDARS